MSATMPTAEPRQHRAAITVDGLQKRYGDFEAVKGISFEVAPGETFGFLGPNGAGKSTTISMLCTLIKPSGGRAEVDGFDVVASQTEVRRRIGLVFQDTTLDDYLTAQENLRFHAELYGVNRAQVETRLRKVMEMVALWERQEPGPHLLGRDEAPAGDRSGPAAFAPGAVP